jgi:hypothetical protein
MKKAKPLRRVTFALDAESDTYLAKGAMRLRISKSAYLRVILSKEMP